MHEGVIVAERVAGIKGVHPLDASKVPGCTYCWPQIASIGMTEAKAKASGRKIKVGRFPFIGNGKGDRARRLPRASSRPCSTRRAASSWAPT